jgi:hypothetical protein
VTEEEFTALSAALTGFGPAELRATGLVGTYLAVAAEQAGARALDRLAAAVPADATEPADDVTELAEAVIHLWYLGSWPGPPAFVVSAPAYARGLLWRTFGGTASAATAPGHGSWSAPPAGSAG